jgi:class 3 adenylate cyclase
MTILMVFCTLWALFAVDVMTIALPKSADKPILGILFGVFLLFCIEVPLELWIQGKEYFEFYFWLDLFTTFSLVPDIMNLFNTTTKSKVLDILTLARAGRAARASSRASRIIRFIKVLNSGNKIKTKKVQREDLDYEVEDSQVTLTQSLIGIKFNEATTRRVVGIVILVLIVLALLDLAVPNDWIEASTGLSGAVIQLAAAHKYIAVQSNQPSVFRVENLDPFLKAFPETVQIVLNNNTVFETGNYVSKYRDSDIETVAGSNYNIIFDIKNYNTRVSAVNISLVVIIVIILAIGNFLFIHKADQLVISPVERMTMIVRQLALNPLTQLKDSRKRMSKDSGVILQMLRKLVGLVQTGFGEAGSAIIAANMAEGGSLDVMKPGRKMRGVFGFCDIRNFTDMTEILNEDCMFLVNSIADILHGNVHSRLGSANKNIGDAFLLVWRLNESVVGKPYTPEPTIAANALNAFLVTIRGLADSRTLSILGKRVPKYAPIKMGFGLHVGWAIEGAVGSTFKIDATYLSPHVNMSARLESLTKAYSASILMSGEFVALLPAAWLRRVRLVDIITVKGSSIPLEIYVIDDQEPVPDDIVLFPEVSKNNPLIVHRAIHAEGMTAFRKGNWRSAAAKFNEFFGLTSDPPTQILLNWMKEVGTPQGDPPSSFEGFRRLTEK